MGLNIKKNIVDRAGRAMDGLGLNIRQQALVLHFADQLLEQVLAGEGLGSAGYASRAHLDPCPPIRSPLRPQSFPFPFGWSSA